jgi:transcriptional regulator with XRE-family HTH domain
MDLHKYKYQDKRGERSHVLPGLNRSALASAVGVSRSQLSRILGGKIEPPIKTLRGLARALGASLDEVDEFLKRLRTNGELNQGERNEQEREQ